MVGARADDVPSGTLDKKTPIPDDDATTLTDDAPPYYGAPEFVASYGDSKNPYRAPRHSVDVAAYPLSTISSQTPASPRLSDGSLSSASSGDARPVAMDAEMGLPQDE